MQREPSLTETVIGWGAALLFWFFVINAITTALAVVICCACYVVWLGFIKPVYDAIDYWASHPKPSQPPVQRTEREQTILAILIMTAILVPLGGVCCFIFLPLGILIWVVWAVAMLALLNPNNLFG